MAKKIFKYKIEVEDMPVLELPEGAEILTVQVQNGEPHLWALVDESRPTKRRYFELYGTGHPVPDAVRNYIGTFQMRGGNLVFHLFELISLIK